MLEISPEIVSMLAEIENPPSYDQLHQFLDNVKRTWKTDVIRTALIKTERHPHGFFAFFTHKRINDMLPNGLKGRQEVVDLMVKVGAFAAKNESLWNLIFPEQ